MAHSLDHEEQVIIGDVELSDAADDVWEVSVVGVDAWDDGVVLLALAASVTELCEHDVGYRGVAVQRRV